MLKVLRIATLFLFVATVGIFALFFVHEKKNTDTTYPEIKIVGDVIEVSIDATEEDFLKGVTAYDGKDGDITSNIVVETISKFIEPGVCKVTYAVADSDNHVVKNSRTIKYNDYTPPRFIMNRALVFNVNETVDISSAIGAVDSIDGDISDKVVITATDYTADTVGVFSVSVQATNSNGDIIYIDMPLHIEDTSVLAPVIELSEYLIYVKKGQEPDFNKYIESVTTINGQPIEYDMIVSTNFDSNIPGVYSVNFYATTTEGYQSHSVLTVVVEE
ncbi:MAG: hypothetical protein J6A49_01470 [Clostridia bacterium]|nr:hypothetical protein [Clostridia bacterium]